MKKIKYALVLALFFSCIKSEKEKGNIHECISICVQAMSPQNTYYYNDVFLKNNIEKKSNFLTKKEILYKKIDSFLFLYKHNIDNNKANISFLKIKNGQMYTFNLLKYNNEWKIIKVDSVQTKVEENEGTKLFYQVEDLKNKKDIR